MARTKKDEVIYTRVTAEMKDQLQAIADQKDASMNTLVNDIIRAYLTAKGDK